MPKATLGSAPLRRVVSERHATAAAQPARRWASSSRIAIAALSFAALQCGTSDGSLLESLPGSEIANPAPEPDGTTAHGPVHADPGEPAADPTTGAPQPTGDGTKPTTPTGEHTGPAKPTPGSATPDNPSHGTPSSENPTPGQPCSASADGGNCSSDDPESDDPDTEEPADPSDDGHGTDDPGHHHPPHGDPGTDDPPYEQPGTDDPPAGGFEPLDPPAIQHVASRFVPPLPAEIADGAGIVRNRDWALVLGKALFWDAQVGSDGQACGSCHFNAGADTRITGQLNPGFLDQTHGAGGDLAFGSNRSDTGAVAVGNMPSGNAAGPGTTLVASDFPLHRLLDETNRNSSVVTDTNDVVGSVGAFAAVFGNVDEQGVEHCSDVDASIFNVAGSHGKRLATRQTEPRNTPTTVNAAFNKRQFWDGRGNPRFNGVGVFGQRDIDGDPNLRLIVAKEGGSPELGALSLDNASLASQAVGPPLSSIEMSCAGRKFADLGRKIARIRPLVNQHVDPTDSVLGGVANLAGSGLVPGYSYASLIQQAFDSKYWSVPGKFRIVNGALSPDESGYTQLETNMSMFWGIAIMMYEATLISDTSEFDSLLLSGDIAMPNCSASAAVDPLLARGCKIFFRSPFGPAPTDGVRGAGCAFCHSGTDTFSEAAVQANAAFPPMLQVADVNGLVGTRDLGFANIGLRPAFVDIGLGGNDPYGNPLAFGRQHQEFRLTNDRSVVKDPFLLFAIDNNALVRGGVFNLTAKLESDGSTKIPTIRNSALTPPYFSYGGYATLRQVMKFYNRGGNRRQLTADNRALEGMPGSTCTNGDTSGTGPDGNHFFPVLNADCNTNTTGLMRPLGLLDCDANGVTTCDVATDDLSAVVRFMESLTDRRVQCDQAPFDHPELALPHGHTSAEGYRPGTAADQRVTLPAVGASGYTPSSGLCIPNAGDLFAPGMQGRVGGVKVPLAP